MKRIVRQLCFGGLVLLAFGIACAWYENDRAYVPEAQYREARAMFIENGSLDLVQRRLEKLQWRRARINETLYRLRKEFEIPDDLAEPTPVP